jgi:hypothetical protein
MAYQMTLVLQGIYERKVLEEALRFFCNWYAWVRVMRDQTGMIEGNLEGILVGWTQGLTTASMEALDSLSSAVKGKSRGYRTVEYMNTMLYSGTGKFTLPCN